MFIESIKFKRTKDSNWERGYYIGETDNASKSVILDANYIPLEKDEDGCSVWDSHTDTNKWICFRCDD
jgi:hypothetical protein